MADLLYPFSFVPPKNTQEKNDLGDSATPDVCVQTRNALIRDINALISEVQSKSRPPERAVINGPALHPFSGLYFLSQLCVYNLLYKSSILTSCFPASVLFSCRLCFKYHALFLTTFLELEEVPARYQYTL